MENVIMNTSTTIFCLFAGFWFIAFAIWLLQDIGVNVGGAVQRVIIGFCYGSGLPMDPSTRVGLLWWHPVVLLLILFSILRSFAITLQQFVKEVYRQLNAETWRWI